MAVMDYQTRDGLDNYSFAIEFLPDIGWRVYVVFQPFRLHDDGTALPHQSIDRNGRRYVDWPVRIDYLGDARTVAAAWAELIQRDRRAEVRAKNPNRAATRLKRRDQPTTDAA